MSADLSQVEIVEAVGGVELTVKVVPGASRSRVIGAWGRALRLTVAAPPQAGRANAAVLNILASTFGVKRAAVEIVSGEGQPLKRIRISGLTADRAKARVLRIPGAGRDG